jgi:hypothetical protein
MLVLLMGSKYAVEMTSDGMIYIPSFMMIDSVIRVNTSTARKDSVLVVLMRRIY